MAENLLNFSIPLDVNVLEQVVQSVYQGSPVQVTPRSLTFSRHARPPDEATGRPAQRAAPANPWTTPV